MKKLALILPVLAFPAMLHAEAAPDVKARIFDMQRQTETALRGQTEPGAIYRLTKSLTWLDLALDELHEDDRTGIIEDAIAEAARLAAGAADTDTPILRGSEKIREDLWQKSAQMKLHKDSDCAMRELAKLDVQLVWAGHEKWESGWTHARPATEVAENLAYDAEQEIARCTEARKPKLVEVPASAASVTATVTIERFTFAIDALFQFDKAGIEHMAAGGQRRLAALAVELKRWKAIESIGVTGHADRVGAEDYNQRLSNRRAASVRDDLIAHGLPAERIAAAGRGEAEPLVQCQGSKRQAGLIACLQPNRRVEIVVRGQKE